MTATAAQQPTPPLVYVVFDAEISITTAESLLATMATLATGGVKEVRLAMSTSGGDVTQGITLYNALRAMPFKLTTHNIGNIDSIGNAVFLAGEKRYAAPHSTFMFHGVSWNIPGAVGLSDKNVRDILDSIEREHDRIGSIIKERTKIAEADIPELFREAKTKDAAQAVSAGIIHEVRDLKIAEGIPVVSLSFKR